nr:E3 ubiquitin-protein ligase UHRF1-like [Cherax quadricarinatus]
MLRHPGPGKKKVYSIVLSGGYEDDEDNGDSFTYTGSGGRDLSVSRWLLRSTKKGKEDRAANEDSEIENEEDGKGKGKSSKRKNNQNSFNEGIGYSEPKKRKSVVHILEKEVEHLIKKDERNSKLWKECKTLLIEGRTQFLNGVEERFLCVCCQELVIKPVTTDCKHNVCQPCLQRSFKADVFTCPACRYDLGKDYPMDINKPLSKCLVALFPGYDAAR